LPSRPGQRARVDAEVHRQRRLVDLEHRQRHRLGDAGDGDADADPLDAVDQDDVARHGLRHLDPVQTLEGQDLVDAALGGRAVRAFHDEHLHAWLERALV
jgi:hypothetical protein